MNRILIHILLLLLCKVSFGEDIKTLEIPLVMESDDREVTVEETLRLPILHIGRSFSEAEEYLQDASDQAFILFLQNIKVGDYEGAVERWSNEYFTVTNVMKFGESLRKLYFGSETPLFVVGKFATPRGGLYLFRIEQAGRTGYRILSTVYENDEWKVSSEMPPLMQVIKDSMTVVGGESEAYLDSDLDRGSLVLSDAVYLTKINDWLVTEEGEQRLLSNRLNDLLQRMSDTGLENGFTRESQAWILAVMKSMDPASKEEFISSFLSGLRSFKYAFRLSPFYILRGGDPRMPWLFLIQEPDGSLSVTNINLEDPWYRLMVSVQKHFDELRADQE